MALPTDYSARKAFPLFTFLTEYFPDAIEELVKISIAGNKQHDNGDGKIRWARDKSTDQLNTAMRHLWDHATSGPIDTDGCYHLGKTAWRALAELQLQIEADREDAADHAAYLAQVAEEEAQDAAISVHERVMHDFYGDVD